MAGPPTEEVQEGKIDKQNELSFLVVRHRDGQEAYRLRFKGKLDGDTIKGTQMKHAT